MVTVIETSLTHAWRLKSHYQVDWWTLRRSFVGLKQRNQQMKLDITSVGQVTFKSIYTTKSPELI